MISFGVGFIIGIVISYVVCTQVYFGTLTRVKSRKKHE